MNEVIIDRTTQISVRDQVINALHFGDWKQNIYTYSTMGDSKVIKESRNLSDNATKDTKEHVASKKDHKQKLDRPQDLGEDDDLASDEPEDDEQEEDSKADYASAGEHPDNKTSTAQGDHDDEEEASDHGSVSDFSEEDEEDDQELLEKLVGCKVNKKGKVLDQDGNIIGEVVSGNRKKAIGRRVKENGAIIDSKGNYIAGVAPVRPENTDEAPADEKQEDQPEDKPEEEQEEATADAPEDEQKQEEDQAEDKPEDQVEDKPEDAEDKPEDAEDKPEDAEDKPEDAEDKPEDQAEEKSEDQAPEEEEKPKNEIPEDANTVDESGKVLSPTGEVVGKLIKGNRHKLAGMMVDEEGNVVDENGNSVGKVELNPPEKPGVPDDANTVDESGKILSPTGEVVGKLKKGNRHKLAGMMVDEEGDVIDENGTLVGKAEFNPPENTEEEEKPKKEVPDDANTVDESGKVLSPTGEVVGKLIKGNRHKLAGMEVDDDGNVVDENGSVVGKAEYNATEKTEEEKKAEAEEQEQRKIAGQMSEYIEQALNRIKPILKMITEHIETEERKPEKERDEEGLVKNVRPLIEEGSNILGEANGAIRGLDPTGKIAKTAQAKSAERKASPEEYRLAELLSNLTGEVTQTIEKAKKKISGMPHAEKELSPLWNLLQNPLLQILAAVGLLLSGVLGLLGNILNGLGLGGLVNNLLGGLGLDKILQNLGVGKLLGGGKKK
jgi:Protein of unknown function (DUF3659)